MSTPDYLWLPDHQLPVAATLSHADELIDQVGELLFTYQAAAGDVVRLREEADGQVNRLVVDGFDPLPRKLPLLVADALVALRAALEHALFAEVERRDGQLAEKAAKTVEIPAKEDQAGFNEWVKGKRKNGPSSLQAGSELVQRIERLQPLHRCQAPSEHPLARLVLHTNHAKHRMPAVAAVMLPVMYRRDQRPESIDGLEKRLLRPLVVGEVLAEAPVGEIVEWSLFPNIGVNRPGTDDWPTLMIELREIADWVREQAVPILVAGDRQGPVLPARYDISVGHEDEREAIAAGTFVSATERHSERLRAGPVRDDLTEMIGTLPGAPSRTQLAEWLDSLSDKEVLTRVDRLGAFREGAMAGGLRVIEILMSHRDEALEYIASRCSG
ncbi:hypothetical protein ABH922_001785 [Rhodococcus sp. 27YEA15]|uniref:hypothetical protein n=1 Tax=Rhodococcus sp. 27YEA15 TaxID=3156259 RepID=UPI003C79752D